MKYFLFIFFMLTLCSKSYSIDNISFADGTIMCDTITIHTVICSTTSIVYLMNEIQLSTICIVDSIKANELVKSNDEVPKISLEREELKVKKYGNISLILAFVWKIIEVIK